MSTLLPQTSDSLPSSLRRFHVSDLLQQDDLPSNDSQLCRLVEGQTVLVTGAAGTVGSELAFRLAELRPKCLLLLDRAPNPLSELELRLSARGFHSAIPLLLNLRDPSGVRSILRPRSPDIVFHLAGDKHFSRYETQPSEALANNLFPVVDLIDTLSQSGVKRFILGSSHLAASPCSVLGAVNRLAEIFVEAYALASPNSIFAVARLESFLESPTGLVQTISRQIENGGPLIIPHRDAAAHFTTAAAAASLLLQIAVVASSGGIYFRELRPPQKVIDLARRMIELRGQSAEDFEIRVGGLPPGEKLDDSPCYPPESLETTEHPRILRLRTLPRPLDRLEKDLRHLREDLHEVPAGRLKFFLSEIIPDYKPHWEH